MRKSKYIAIAAMAFGFSLYSCNNAYLEESAKGALSDEVLANESGIKKLLIGTYAALDGQVGVGNPWETACDNWIYGTVAGGDASKGSYGGDQPAIDPIAKASSNGSNGFFNSKWLSVYEGVTRANSVLLLLSQVEGIDENVHKNLEGQAKFLRAHYYFDLKKMFNMVPWIDETTTDFNQPNNVDIWPMIEADFKFAFDNLPETQPEVGRANKWAAGAYLAKTYLYQQKFAEAKALFDQVIAQGQTSNGLDYALVDKFEHNFNPAFENNSESVFAVQMVAHDGTNSIANAREGGKLNHPYNSPFRCCGFLQPSQDLVNSYSTNPATGLPYLNDYNSHPVKSDMGLNASDAFTPYTGTVDPRLDWTAGRRGLPFLDWGYHPGQTWIRDQAYGGPYAPKKNIYWQETQDLYADQSSWAPGSAINVLIIRFADVLLMAAEAEANLGNLDKAQDYVNIVRARAANPVGWVYDYVDASKPMDGFSATPAANYEISVYPAGAFTGMGKAGALKAIHFERKLELAMEGHRFFDLVRWGTAEQVLNAYFAFQGAITTDVSGGSFTAPNDMYFPIPQAQIDKSVVDGEPLLKQNPGYN